MDFDITDEEGIFLIRLARNAVQEHIEKNRVIKPPETTSKNLFNKCGVFVTINLVKKGKKELRGCIGYPYPIKPLVEAVIETAINSATKDPRFFSISKDELGQCLFELSILTPPELVQADKPIDYTKKIRIGKHGLIVQKGYQSGLLLPQVPIEWGWCAEEFICQCCLKAGLSADSWLTRGVEIFRFRAIIFEEISPRGEIKRKKL